MIKTHEWILMNNGFINHILIFISVEGFTKNNLRILLNAVRVKIQIFVNNYYKIKLVGIYD